MLKHRFMSIMTGVVAMTAALGLVPSLPVQAVPIRSHSHAIEVLRDRITRDRIYRRPDCLFFMEEGEPAAGYDIAIRAKQGGRCPGDPMVAPVLARFRVLRGGGIVWYDPVSDRYLPYSQFRQQYDSYR